MLKHAVGCSWRCFATRNKQETLELVKQLRAQTGAPLGDVKKALENSNYDIGLASEALRVLGVAAVARKASRLAREARPSIVPGDCKHVLTNFRDGNTQIFEAYCALSVLIYMPAGPGWRGQSVRSRGSDRVEL